MNADVLPSLISSLYIMEDSVSIAAAESPSQTCNLGEVDFIT
jgi:hypothetical protein